MVFAARRLALGGGWIALFLAHKMMVMLSMRVVHAGEGYAYLMNSVASHDDETAPEMRLGDYYNASGTPPGRWFGKGLNGLGKGCVR